MTYYHQFKSGNMVIPAALLFHFKDIFAKTDHFLVWLFFFYQNTSQYDELAPSTIAEATGLSVAAVNQAMTDLQEAGLLEFKTIELAGEIEMIFDALPALEKLDGLTKEKPEQTLQDLGSETKKLVADFERELGRFLSPFEIEDLQKTLQEDRLSPDLVRAALREAVFNGKQNWKYIQAILRNWQREGISTPEQVELRQQERDNKQNPKAQDLHEFQAALNLWKD